MLTRFKGKRRAAPDSAAQLAHPSLVDASNRLQTALQDFQSLLTPEQKLKASNSRSRPDTQDVVKFTIELDEHNAKQSRRCVAGRIRRFLECVQQFSSVVDTFVASSEIGALVWGSVKVTFLIAVNIFSYFDKLSELVMNLGSDYPRCELYRDLYPQSERLKASLLSYYTTLVNLCTKAVEVGQRSAIKQFSLASWRSFDIEFAPLKTSLSENFRKVNLEIRLASDQAVARAQSLQEDEQKAMKIFRKDVDVQLKEDSNFRLQIIKRDRKEKLLKKLAEHPYETSWYRLRKDRWADTCAWFIDCPEFKDWQINKEWPVLWCSGDRKSVVSSIHQLKLTSEVGCGKSVLSSNVVATLIQNPNGSDAKIAYFFCDFSYPSSLTARVILGCLLQQLLGMESLSSKVEEELEASTRLGFAGPAENLGALLQRVVGEKSCDLVIDGVDECSCEELKSLFSALQSVVATGNCRLFISSRPLVAKDIGKYFPKYKLVSIRSQHTSDDIAKFVDGAIQKKLEDGDLAVDEQNVILEIRSALTLGANGMFLWVKLQLDDVCSQPSDYDIRETLSRLPKTLSETYERALRKIHNTAECKIIEKELRWIAASKRPMTLPELREACAIETTQNWRHVDRYINDTSRLVTRCAGLVTLDEEDKTVVFVHPSAQTFLTEVQRSSELGETSSDSKLNQFFFGLSDANSMIGEACVTYLHFNDLKRQLVKASKAAGLEPSAILAASLHAGLNSAIAKAYVKMANRFSTPSSTKQAFTQKLRDTAGFTDLDSLQRLQEGYPFLVYASENWLVHTADLSPSKTIWSKWRALIEDENSNAQLPWTYDDLHNATTVVQEWVVQHEHVALLHFITPKLNWIVPLFVSVVDKGDCKLLEVLLQNLTLSKLTKQALSSLCARAASRGNSRMIDILLSAGADINMDMSFQRSESALFRTMFLSDAAHSSALNDAALSSALDWSYKPHEFDESKTRIARLTPLHIAVQNGHDDVVIRLLASNADVNKLDERHGTPLLLAAKYGHLAIAENLLAAGASVSMADDHGWTPLQMAAFSGHLAIVKILLAADADVNALDEAGTTALLKAATEGHLAVVEILLAAHADVDAAGDSGVTPLIMAAKYDNQAVVETLLAANADVNKGNVDGVTPLIAAATSNRLAILETLLAAHADFNKVDTSRYTALSVAKQLGFLEIVNVLRRAGAQDVELKGTK